MLARAKSIVLETCRATGGFRLVAASRWRAQKLLVLCYHGISHADEHEWDPDLYLSPTVFESRLRFLKEGGYNVLTLQEGIERLRRNSLPPKSVVITFDDGFADFRWKAWPLLQQYGFPATVYLTTWYVFANRPIFNLVVPYMLWKQRNRRIDRVERFGWTQAPDLSGEPGRRQAWQAILQTATANRLSGSAKIELAADVASELGIDYAALERSRILRLMSPAESAAVAEGHVSLELHTHRHRTPADLSLFARELEDNRVSIQEICGRNPSHFCYPSGRHRPDMLPVLRSANVESATTCEYGLATSATERLLIPRLLDVNHMPELTFASWLCGLGSLLPHRGTDSPDQESV